VSKRNATDRVCALIFSAALVLCALPSGAAPPLGLPPLPPAVDNPQTAEKIALGDKLFHDIRFSSNGEVSCATCHDLKKAFTDSPLKVSEGIKKLTGTRNAPTVVNAAYFDTFFWDGRSPSLEDQALHPFLNPVEMGLETHEPILKIVRSDPAYVEAFTKVFAKTGPAVTMTEVTQAIAAFERAQISGNTPFDRWYFGGEQEALTPEQQRGFEVFVNQGRCVSCHVVEQTQALFTDNRFHNIGVGINQIQDEVPGLATKFLAAEYPKSEVDVEVLSNKRSSELGRFAVTRTFDGLGAFKTPTLRNIAVTAPYMHDGSLATLRDVVVHYNNGGVTQEGDRVNDFLSGGIRPLGLNDAQIDDLVLFMEALTSPDYTAKPATAGVSASTRATGSGTAPGFLNLGRVAALPGSLPLGVVQVAFADPADNFSFAYISDSHIQHIEGDRFVRNWDRGLIRAVAEVNLLQPKPDFVVFGGDLAQLGNQAELDHGAEMLAKLDFKTHHVMGEHDYYLDLGTYWSKLFGPHYYSWDHKGVHFIVLNSILTNDQWTHERWPSAEQRMLEMAGLDNPNGSPFMVGEVQRAWLREDLKKVGKKTPIVLFSHSPIQKIYKGWNFWTEDAEEVQALLKPFKKVNVVYGHVHQIQYNQIGNISFQAVMATAWPWPYPESYAQAEADFPEVTVPMNRADPFFERDATGWQTIGLMEDLGRVSMRYNLYNNRNRTVQYNPKTRRPEDVTYQGLNQRIDPQVHY